MKKPTKLYPIATAFVFVFLVLASCTNSKDAPPFPYMETEYKQPTIKNFEFSKSDTIVWKTKDAGFLNRLPTKKFDWDKLPATKVDFGLPKPLKGKIETNPFRLDSLPHVPFSMDSLPEANLKIKVNALGEPEIIEVGVFDNLKDATRGVMSANTDFSLPSTARTIIKDSEGMLWIGMDGRIARFDSEKLEIYGLEQGLNNTAATALFEDSKGRLWVGNTEAISVIDFEGKLIYELSSSLPTSSVYGIIEANDGKFWLSRRSSGYDIIDLDNKTVHQFTEDKGLLGTFNLKPYQDKEGLIWLSSANGVNIIDLKMGKNIKFTPENGLLSTFTANFFEDNKGRLWIGTQKGANMLNTDRSRMSLYANNELFEGMDGLVKIFQDASGTFWMGGANGMMYQMDETNGILQKFTIDNTPARAMVYIVEDRDGQIWVAVPQGGLYKIDPKTGRPGNFTKGNGLNSNAVWNTLETKDGKIWIGTYEGIDIYDPKMNTIKHLTKENGLVSDRNPRLKEDSKGRVWAVGSSLGVSIIDPTKETIQELTSLQGLETNSISGLAEVRDGEFWLGGSEGELINLDINNATLKSYLPSKAAHISQNNVILKDGTNTVWIAGIGSGIQKIDTATNERVFITTEEGLLSNTVYSITLDPENNIWAATDLGVQHINVKTNEITSFTTAEGLAANDVYALAVHKGEVFTGTSRGLTILKPIDQPDSQQPNWKVKTIGKTQGLDFLDFSENSFTFDRNDKFWAGVQGAMLTVMDEIVVDTTSSITHITGINILDRKQQFYDKELVQAKRAALDTLWLANDKESTLGQTTFSDLGSTTIEGIQWQSVAGPYNVPVGLTLPNTQNYLSFNYNGIYYANPDQVVYRYILEGIDKNWSPISKETVSENYRDLPPGEYTFKVASKGFNDIWTEPSSFDFTILPPWWQTWWATLLFFLLGVTAIWFIIDYRSRWLQKENRILEERVTHRTAQLKHKIDELKETQSQLIQSEKMASLGELTAGIAHEIQNPLNFVNNFSEVNKELLEEMKEEIEKGNYQEVKALVKDVSDNEDKIIYHGKRADGIVKGMLQHSRSSSGLKEPTDINVLADEYLRLAYHGLRAKDKSFNAILNTDFDQSIGDINIVPQDIGRVILNLITNAFYVVKEKKELHPHDFEPTVTVSTKKKDAMVMISVTDNGNGVSKKVLDKIFQPFFTTKPSGKGTGLGLSLSYDIVKVHHGELTVKTEEGKGTTFIISLPIT